MINKVFKKSLLCILALSTLFSLTSCVSKDKVQETSDTYILDKIINETKQEPLQSSNDTEPKKRVQGDYFEYESFLDGDKELSNEVLGIFNMVKKTVIHSDTFNQDCEHLKSALQTLKEDIEKHSNLMVRYKMAKLENEVRVFIWIGRYCYPSGYTTEYSDTFIIPIL